MSATRIEAAIDLAVIVALAVAVDRALGVTWGLARRWHRNRRWDRFLRAVLAEDAQRVDVARALHPSRDGGR